MLNANRYKKHLNQYLQDSCNVNFPVWFISGKNFIATKKNKNSACFPITINNDSKLTELVNTSKIHSRLTPAFAKRNGNKKCNPG
jgi:hypothetical protein